MATATEVGAGEEAGLQVVVQDEAGNPIPNQQVSFTPLSNGTTVTPAQAPTNPQGEAGAVVRTSTSGREPYTPYDCRAAAPGRRDPRHRRAPSQVTLQTDSLETVASGTVTVTVQVRDAHGNAWWLTSPCNSRRLPLLPRSRPQHCGRMHRDGTRTPAHQSRSGGEYCRGASGGPASPTHGDGPGSRRCCA